MAPAGECAFSFAESTDLTLPLERHWPFRLTAIRCKCAAQSESAKSDGDRRSSDFLFGFFLERIANGRKQLLRVVGFCQEIFHAESLKVDQANVIALSG
jgi:hypothetical protein